MSGKPGRSAAPIAPGEALRDARRHIRLLEQEDEVLRRAAAYPSQAYSRDSQRAAGSPSVGNHPVHVGRYWPTGTAVGTASQVGGTRLVVP